jgi:hypothetical protein
MLKTKMGRTLRQAQSALEVGGVFPAFLPGRGSDVLIRPGVGNAGLLSGVPSERDEVSRSQRTAGAGKCLAGRKRSRRDL